MGVYVPVGVGVIGVYVDVAAGVSVAVELGVSVAVELGVAVKPGRRGTYNICPA